MRLPVWKWGDLRKDLGGWFGSVQAIVLYCISWVSEVIKAMEESHNLRKSDLV